MSLPQEVADAARAGTLVVIAGSRFPAPRPGAPPAPGVLVRPGEGRGLADALLAAAGLEGPEAARSAKRWLGGRVVLLLGYRLDDGEFAPVVAALSELCGGHLPRCHAAVPAEGMTDVTWQKWAWRGVVVFAADPADCLAELEGVGR